MRLAHRHRYPGLWRPGVAPRGPVMIDWTHPLAVGLVGYWLLSRPGLAGNLVTGAAYPPRGDGAGVTQAVGADGPAMRFTAATANGVLDASDLSDGAGPAFSVATRCIVPPAGAATHLTMGVRSVSANLTRNGFGVLTTGAPLYRANYGVAASPAATNAANFSDGVTPCTLVGVSRAANNHRLYVDGVQDGFSGTASGGSYDRAAATIGAGGVGSAGRPGVTITFFAAWSRALTDDDARLIAADPYALLIPAG